VQLKDAHARIKLHEQDKAILAQKVLSAEEERKTLDRKILEIKTIMHGDTVYREALTERNEVLQLKINHLRKKTMSCNCSEMDASDFEVDSQMKKPEGDGNEKENRQDFRGHHHEQSSIIDELSSLGSAPVEEVKKHQVEVPDSTDVTPLSRKYAYQQHRRLHRGISPGRRRFSESPRAAVSLHNPSAICYRSK